MGPVGLCCHSGLEVQGLVRVRESGSGQAHLLAWVNISQKVVARQILNSVKSSVFYMYYKDTIFPLLVVL